MKDLHLQLRSEKRRKKQATEKETSSWKFERETKVLRNEESWRWIQKGYLKIELEDLLFAAQEQVLRSNLIRTLMGEIYQKICGM